MKDHHNSKMKHAAVLKFPGVAFFIETNKDLRGSPKNHLLSYGMQKITEKSLRGGGSEIFTLVGGIARFSK